MLTHEAKPDLTLIQTMGQMIHEIGYQLKLSPEIRARATESARLAWASDGEELELQVDLDVDDAQVITLVPGTQLGFELEFVFRELENPYGCFELLDTTVFHDKFWSHTMLEAHEDVGDEIAILIENVAASHYYSGTR